MTQRILTVGHTTKAAQTRPANTDPYSIGDAVGDGTVMVFPRTSRGVGEFGIIRHATLISSSYTATALIGELWLFDATIGVDADNAAFTPTDAELETLVGVINFPAASWKMGTSTAGTGGNHVCPVTCEIPFVTTPDVNALYGVLVARNAYVPIASEVFTVRLTVQD